jgi:endonuclease G
MKKFVLSSIVFFIIQTFTFGQQEVKTNDNKTVLLYEDGTWSYADSIPLFNIKPTVITKLEIPKINYNEFVTTHTGYSLSYNEIHEQANWVAYELTKEKTNKQFERTNKFIIDPKIKTKSANDKDYKGSGYDRGHLAPASDMGYSKITMGESFYYSNMSPQLPGFNRGIWKRLEELVRTWAVENNNVYIVTGPILTNGLPTIGTNNVSIPLNYYKVILDYTEPSIKGIGFIMPNNSSNEPLQNYAVSIDSIEKFIGIDFFPMLPDDQEDIIEKTLCIKCWDWKSSKGEITLKDQNITKDENRLSTSVQCEGTSKSGNQCKNKTLNISGYCYLHESQNTSTRENSIVKKKKEEVQSGTTPTGIPSYTGPRGGIYHYSKSGKKVYSKKK